jgi:cytochrome P450
VTETVDPFVATGPGERVALYRALAEAGPVQRFTLPMGKPAWLVTGHAEVRAALNEPRLVKAAVPLGNELRKDRMRAASGLTQHLLAVDGADHARLRRLVSAAFTRRRMDALAPVIQRTADALLDDLAAAADAQVDLVAGYAYPLPMTVICDLLGVPAELREDLHLGTKAMATSLGISDDEYLPAFDRLVETLDALVELKRRDPRDDLISALIAARDGEDSLTEDELKSMIWLLVAAGHETTAHLIGNGMHALLSHPEQLELLRTSPDQISGAVEEMLRWCGPVQVTIQLYATESLVLGGVQIKPGDLVLPALLPANRDPEHTPNPDALDVAREPQSHVAFGHGVHHCLGAPMARLEARIAFEALLRRFPHLRPAEPLDELPWLPSFLFHGLVRLPVHLS